MINELTKYIQAKVKRHDKQVELNNQISKIKLANKVERNDKAEKATVVLFGIAVVMFALIALTIFALVIAMIVKPSFSSNAILGIIISGSLIAVPLVLAISVLIYELVMDRKDEKLLKTEQKIEAKSQIEVLEALKETL